MANIVITENEYYTLSRTDNGFVAELHSAVLSGVPGLPNIELWDSNELLLAQRAAKIVRETICPTDPVVRRMISVQRQLYQQTLIP